MRDPRRTVCSLCDNPGTLGNSCEVVEVDCNVRRFADQRFTVWRCNNCRSIHSRDVVDLAGYYEDYPFQRQKTGFALRWISGIHLRRLRKAGLTREKSLLDYGCGSGLFVEWLRGKGYRNVNGLDPYSKRYADRSVLEGTYDFVVLQDVLEHAEEPSELLDEVVALTAAGGVICVGTPNAEELDLGALHECVHSLHQPYHLHIPSAAALQTLAESRGLAIERFYDVFYADTFLPFVNVRFFKYYSRVLDNTLDLVFDTPRLTLPLLHPRAFWLAFLGRFRPPRSEMMFVFRKPGCRAGLDDRATELQYAVS